MTYKRILKRVIALGMSAVMLLPMPMVSAADVTLEATVQTEGSEQLQVVGTGSRIAEEDGFVIDEYGNLIEYTGNDAEVVIPDGVKEIWNWVFYDCNSLTSVKIPESVTDIGIGTFGGCNSLTSIELPEGVTNIGDSAFSGCSSLTNVEIPKSVTSIGEYAFSGCSNLTSVEIPGSVTYIKSGVFQSCSSLASVEIPESVTSIGRSAFWDCSSLISVKIPESVTDIEGNAFWGCNSLTSVEIPKSVTSIGNGAFGDCSNLENIKVSESNTAYDSRDNCNALIETESDMLIIGCKNTEIPGSVTSIGSYAFSGCSSLTSMEIPGSVTSIGSYAFSGCSSLTSMEIPGSVTSIGNDAFGDCSNLENIKVSGSNTVYDSRDNCNALIETESDMLIIGCKNTEIPGSVTSIGECAFSGCSSLTSVEIPGSVTSIGWSAFGDCSSLISVKLPESVTDIGSSAFEGCSSLTSMKIPGSVTNIGSSAFEGCSNLENIKVSESNTVYDSRDNCNAIIKTEKNELIVGCKNTEIPGSVTGIGGYAFRGCNSLTSVEIPESVTSIGEGAFDGCESLTSMKIPGSLTSISRGAFFGCSSLTSVEIPESVTYVGDSAFGKTKWLENERKKNPCVVVNHILIDGEICSGSINVPEGVTKIGELAFAGCGSLTSVKLPRSVTSIEEWAFYCCRKLKSVEIPESVTSIGSRAFRECYKLKVIYGVEGSYAQEYAARKDINFSSIQKEFEIVNGVLKKYNGIAAEVVIPDGVTSIGDNAFYKCNTLKSVKIPDGVTSIGEWAFGECRNLVHVNIPESVTDIGDYAFYFMEGYYSLTSVMIPSSVTSIGEFAIGFYDPPNDNGKGAENIPDFVIYGESGSAAEAYAKENGFDFVSESMGKTSIAKAEVTLSQDSYVYDGKAKTPDITAKLDGKTLILNTDYTVSYRNNINPGTAEAILTGKGSYTGTVTKNFTITSSGGSSATTPPVSTQPAKKSPQVLNVTKGYSKIFGNQPFKLNADLTSGDGALSYTSSNTKVVEVDKASGIVTMKGCGIATITVNAAETAKYDAASAAITIIVSPAKLKTPSVKTQTGKKLKVSWKKDKNASGYDIQYSTDKKFKTKKATKMVTVKKNKTTSKTIKKLKAGKKYYVRVRSYVNVKTNGKTQKLTGAWSNKKMVTI